VSGLVRARYLHQWLAAVAREDDPWRARFFAGLAPGDREAIEGASRVAWVPVDLHVRLSEVLHDAFGAARAHEYYRRAFARSLREPPFDALVRTGLRVLGVTPASFLRWAARGWQLSFRDSGDVHGEVLGENSGRLVYRDLPVCTASDPWLDSAQGSAYGVFDLVKVAGVVRIDKSARARGGMTLEVEWT
jgi:hypothetical protein